MTKAVDRRVSHLASAAEDIEMRLRRSKP